MITKADKRYLSQLKIRYKKARKIEKIIILNEFTKTTGYDRKYAGKLLRGMRLRKKIRIGSKIKKIHDKATTPYRRILRVRDVSRKVKDKLRAQYKTLSLVALKEKIDEVLTRLKPTALK